MSTIKAYRPPNYKGLKEVLRANIQSVSTGFTRRKIQHQVYNKKSIIEDTGVELRTYSFELMTVGANFESDRNKLESLLISEPKIIINDIDIKYGSYEVVSFSMSQSRMAKGICTFSLKVIESPEYHQDFPNVVNSSQVGSQFLEVPKLSMFSKIGKLIAKAKAIYGKVNDGINKFNRLKGLTLATITQARGIINKVLNFPNSVLNSATGFVDAIFDEFSKVDIHRLGQLFDTDIVPIIYIPKSASDTTNPLPDEYIETTRIVNGVSNVYWHKELTKDEVEFEAFVKSMVFSSICNQHIGLLEGDTTRPSPRPFTLEDSEAIRIKLRNNYQGIYDCLSDDLRLDFSDIFSNYLDAIKGSDSNLKSVKLINIKTALIPDVFNLNNNYDTEESMDVIYSLQDIQLEGLFITYDLPDSDVKVIKPIKYL